MYDDIAIMWFRQDLRLSDNPALTLAIKHQHVLPIYILDDNHAGDYKMGGASLWWLHHSLQSLNHSLDGALSCYYGNALDILQGLCQKFNITAIYYNRCYEAWRIQRDTKIKQYFKEKTHINITSTNASLLWEPHQIKKKDGSHYKVFTPFYQKGCLNAAMPHMPLKKAQYDSYQKDKDAIDISVLLPLPHIHWYDHMQKIWHIGEEAAQKQWQDFLKNKIKFYKEGRDYPNQANTSHLSPYLHFGEISPHQLWHDISHIAHDDNIAHFRKELAWREFSHHLLYYYPDLPQKNLQTKFDQFEWRDDADDLKAWQEGKTGIPMVDAGMRQLWQTGYMHNRVRMIVGSFLVKNLRLHWHHGFQWFWDTLCDADLANNSASWQWIAGCGADAAPYFRIFNPVTQGQKFDADGDYIRQYIPEIAQLPNKYLFSPWLAPNDILIEAGIILGKNYPLPIVDLKKSREDALLAFKKL
jgi:deoxyribodipyrimidine photo-lyase